MDDPIHTIKMQTSLTVREGWGLADGEANSGLNGGTGEDFRGRVPIGVESRSGAEIPEHSDAAYQLGSTGGSRTHAHAGTANVTGVGAGVTGNAISSNVQPWGVVVYVQRLNNSVNFTFP